MQRERLIELILNSGVIEQFFDYEMQEAERLADYLLENGVIVPPCKVGDMVYDIGGFPKIMKAEIETITTDGTEMSSVVVNQNKPYHSWFVNWRDIGKTVFLTREAAEKELKERDEK